MKEELLAFTRLSHLFTPLPAFDWPLLLPQLALGVLLVLLGVRFSRIRLWGVASGLSLFLITGSRYLSILYLGSRIVLLLWLITSSIGLVWQLRQPRVEPNSNEGTPVGLLIPKKRRQVKKL